MTGPFETQDDVKIFGQSCAVVDHAIKDEGEVEEMSVLLDELYHGKFRLEAKYMN